MNIITISLSSNSSSYSINADEIELFDHTLVKLDLSTLYKDIIPSSIVINWGDTVTNESYYSFSKLNEYSNSFVTNFEIFTNLYKHEYYPSPSSLYKCLSAQILITYSDYQSSKFVLPIKIKTSDYFDTIDKMTIHNVEILDTENNEKMYTFKELSNGYFFEMRGD
jgi:hypothetical protein